MVDLVVRRRTFMNIFEVFAVGLVVFAIVMVSRLIAPFFGVDAWIIGVGLAGIVFGSWAIWAHHLRKTEYPPCVNNRCSPDQYRGVSYGAEGVVVECACGVRYLQTWDKRLMVLGEDGKPQPYKRRIRGGEWIDDVENRPDR